jgi:thiamine transport system substrate-binding protein
MTSRTRRRAHARRLAPLVLAELALTACARDEGPVSLTLLTHDSFDVSDDVLAAFTEDTGVEVRIVPLGDAGTALNQAILTRDAPQGDLLFGVDSTFLARALDADLFLAHTSPALADIDPAVRLDPSDRLTPVDVGDVCLNVDLGWFAARAIDPPIDIVDLVDPAYRSLTVVQNPATSSPGLAFLLATIARLGEDAAFDFWAEMRANDVRVTEGWSDAYYAAFSATGGDRPIVVSYATSPVAEVVFADPPVTEAPTGVVSASCFRQVEFVGILASTPHPDEARALVDFLLSETFQADVPLTMFVQPVRRGTPLPDVFVRHATVVDDPLTLDPALVDERRDAWIERWTATVLR